METINILRDGNMTKSLIKLGMPVVIAMLVMAVNNVVDTFWVARLGTLPIAAVSIAFPISLFFYRNRINLRDWWRSLHFPTAGSKSSG